MYSNQKFLNTKNKIYFNHKFESAVLAIVYVQISTLKIDLYKSKEYEVVNFLNSFVRDRVRAYTVQR